MLRYEVEADDLAWTVTNDLKPGSKVAIEKVFTRFYTEVASRTNTEASGLGLYLSKKIVERMNGKMDAKLEEDQFILTVRLPIHRVRL
ncbi:sensory histidine kinase CreC [compost metagenome]